MTGFDKGMRLKGNAEENRYFAELDRERVTALHEGAINSSRDKQCREAKRDVLDCSKDGRFLPNTDLT